MGGERLSDAKSPYLRGHASDPVSWWPWSAEALAEARSTGTPILLSCGYSACHWCHVMQRESFRDEETAAYLNENFVCIKVDREERPDVDRTYQAYVEATMGSGGWPLTVFLTPELAPLLGGTYFPKKAPRGGASLLDIAEAVVREYRSEPDRVAAIAEKALDFLRQHTRIAERGPVTGELVTNAADLILRWVDTEHGGFGETPKFPQTMLLRFLLAFADAAGDEGARMEAERGAQALLRGGIFDHAGGGIFRYATDRAWLVPHFEKMLYDNALLLTYLGELYRARPEEEYAVGARRIAEFLTRDLALPGGGFASSLSAETRGVEGGTYLWRYDDLAEALTAEELALAERRLGVRPEGVFEGHNILTRHEGRRDDAEAVDALLARILHLRGSRPQPDRDDKCVVSWNALAAEGLITAGEAIGDPTMVAAGLETLRFLLAEAVTGDDIVHVLDDPAIADVRFVDDYAALAAACITAGALAAADDMLPVAGRLHAAAAERFIEDDLILMNAGDTLLPVRPNEQHDDPTPSGASLMLLNAVRLERLTGEPEYAAFAARMMPSFWGLADYGPLSAGTALIAMLEHLAAQGT